MKITLRTADVVAAAAALGGAAYMFSETFAFPPPPLPHLPSAALFPRFALAIIVLASILVAFPTLARQKGSSESAEIDIPLGRLGFVAALGTVYGVALNSIGFEAATFGTLAIGLIISTRRPAPSVAIALIATIVFYVLFVLVLRVSVPLAFLPQYLSQIVRI